MCCSNTPHLIVYCCEKPWQSFAWKGYCREIERAKSWPSSPQVYSITSEGTSVDIVRTLLMCSRECVN